MPGTTTNEETLGGFDGFANPGHLVVVCNRDERKFSARAFATIAAGVILASPTSCEFGKA